MKYAVVFLLIGSGLAAEAAVWRGWWLLFVWPAASFIMVGAAYGWLGPGVFRKRRDGTMGWGAVLPLLPYLLFAWATWHVQRLRTREPAVQEITPGLLIGRRPLRGEVPEAVTAVVDLTAEFGACRAAIGGRPYRCLPTLDARPADARAFADLARDVALSGPVLVHCAQGHGRSGMLVAAVLVARGTAADVDGALAMIRRVRPGVRLSRVQRVALDRLVSDLAPVSR